jgi:porin
LGIGFNWSHPAEDVFGPGLDDQYTAEIYYRFQVMKVLTVTPDVQHIIVPALNPWESSIWVLGLRARLAL